MKFLLLCALLGTAAHCKPGGYFRQEYQFKKSSATYQNNQLQTKDDDQGFYHKQGDLEGPAKVQQHNEQSQYVSPDLGGLGQTLTAYDNRDLTDEAERAFTNHGLGVQGLKNAGAGGRSYSSYSSYSSYGSTSTGKANLRELKQNLQADLEECLRDAMAKYRSEGSYRSQSYMESQLKTNLTKLLQEALHKANPSSSVAYTVTATGVYNPQNRISQELTDMRNELERRFLSELHQEIQRSSATRGTTRSYYDSQEVEDLNRPYVQEPKSAYSDIQYSHSGNNRYVGTNIQQSQSFSENQATERTSYASALTGRADYNTHSQARYQPIHVQINPSVRLTDVMQNVQNTIHKQISEALRAHEVKYSDGAYRLTNARPSYEASLGDFKEQVRYNLTDLIQRELEKNYGVQTKLQGYSFSLNAGNTANYKLEDFDDLKRTVENNLNTFLENTLRTQETRHQQQVSAMSVRNRDYTSHGPQFTKSLTDTAAYTKNHQFTRSPVDSAPYTSHNPQFTKTPINSAYYSSHNPQFTQTPIDSVPYTPDSSHNQHASSLNGYASHNQYSNAYSSSSYQSEELEEMTRRLQGELSRQLQKAVEDHRRSQSYTQQNPNTQELYQQLESELKRNITEQLQRSLQKSYGDQGRRGGYSYTVTSGVYNPSANYRTQDLDAMMKQMQFDLEKQLREQVNKQGNYRVISSGPYVLHSQPSNSFKKYQQFSSYSRSSSGDSIGEDCAETGGVDHENLQHRYKREAYGYYGHNPQYHQHTYQHHPYNFQQHERVYNHDFHQQATHHNHQYFQQPENEREEFHPQSAHAQHFQQPENERVYHLGQQPVDLDDLGQQPEDLGQQLVDLDNLGQQPEDLGQQLVDVGLGQRLEDQDFDNLGQTADNYDDYFELTPHKPKPATVESKPYDSGSFIPQNPSSLAKPTYGNPAYGNPVGPTYGNPVRPTYGNPVRPTYGNPARPTYGNPPSSTNPIYESPSPLAKPSPANSLSLVKPIYERPSAYENPSFTKPTYGNPQKPTSVTEAVQKPQNSASLTKPTQPQTPSQGKPKFVQPENEIPEEELGQQLEELGQEIEDLGGLHQQSDSRDLGQLDYSFENLHFGKRDETSGNGKPQGQQVEELGQQLEDLENLGQQLEDLDGLTQQTEDVYGKLATGQVLEDDWGQQNQEDFAKLEGQSQNGFGKLKPQLHPKSPQTQPGFAKVEPQTNFGQSQHNFRTPVNPNTARNYDDVINIEDLIPATPRKSTYKPYRGIGLPRPTTTPKPAVQASYGDFQEIEDVFTNHRNFESPKKPRFDLNPPTPSKIEPKPVVQASYGDFQEIEDVFPNEAPKKPRFDLNPSTPKTIEPELEPDYFTQKTTSTPFVYVHYTEIENKNTPVIYRDFNGEIVNPKPATYNTRPFNTQNNLYPISPKPVYVSYNNFSPKPPLTSSSSFQPDEDSQQLAKDIFGNVKPVDDFKNHGDYLEYVGDRKDITHMESADQVSQKQENPLIHSQRGLGEARNLYIGRTQGANSPRYIQFNGNQGNQPIPQSQSALSRGEALSQKPDNLTQQSEDFGQQMEEQSEDLNDLTQQSEDLTQQVFGNHDLPQQSEDLTQHSQDFRYHGLTQQTQNFRDHDLTQQSEDLTRQSQNFRDHDLTQQSEDLTQQSPDFRYHGLTQQTQNFRDHDLTQQSEDLTRQSQNFRDHDLTQQSEDLTQQSQDFRYHDLTQQSEDLTRHSQDFTDHDLTQQSEDLTRALEHLTQRLHSRQESEDLHELTQLRDLEDLTQRPKTSYEPARPLYHATVNNPPMIHYGRSLPNSQPTSVNQGGGEKVNPLAESIYEASSTTEAVEVETEPAEPKGFWKSFGGKITNSFSTVKQKAKDLMG